MALMIRYVSLTKLLSQTEADIETWYILLSWRVILNLGEVTSFCTIKELFAVMVIV